jgi:hypothetical protein
MAIRRGEKFAVYSRQFLCDGCQLCICRNAQVQEGEPVDITHAKFRCIVSVSDVLGDTRRIQRRHHCHNIGRADYLSELCNVPLGQVNQYQYKIHVCHTDLFCIVSCIYSMDGSPRIAKQAGNIHTFLRGGDFSYRSQFYRRIQATHHFYESKGS